MCYGAFCVSGDERRKEPRFSGVSIRLIYSPLEGGLVTNLGRTLYESFAVNMSLNGLAFDIDRAMKVGDKLLILVHGSSSAPVERLTAEIVWQTEIEGNIHRIGTRIISADLTEEGEELGQIETIQHGVQLPKQAEMICPACNQMAIFKLVGVQAISDDKELNMPLYDCSRCGTTRTITSLLATNRRTESGQQDN